MYTYASGSPGTFGALTPTQQALQAVRISEIQAAITATAGYPPIQAKFASAMAAAQAGHIASAESQYYGGRQLAIAAGLGSRIPHLKALSKTTSTSTEVAKGVTSVADTITTALKNAFATPEHPTPAQQGGVVPQTQPGQASVTGWIPKHAVTDARDFLQKKVGPLPVWQWGVAVGGVVIAASVITKVAKYALIGGAVAGGAILAGKAGGVIR